MIIENALIHIISNLKSYENKSLRLWNKLYLINYAIKNVFLYKVLNTCMLFIWDTQNISANSYIVDTI